MNLTHDFQGRLGSAIALAAGLLAAGPALAETTVTAVMHSGLRGLDPVLSTAHITRNHAYMIYDVIAAMDADQMPQPQMASWEISEDGKTYTFTLRDGLKFHDGAPVTAADAVASLKRWGVRDPGGQFIFGVTESLEPTSDTVFVWTLSEPFPQLVPTLAKPSIPPFVMPARIADTPADTAITEYVGSGPFVFDEAAFQPGVSVTYHKFADYLPRGEAPSGLAGGKTVNVDTVTWVNMPDAQTAVNALSSDEIDLIETVPFDLLPVLELSEGVVAEKRDPFGNQYYARMNFTQPPFDNILIRQAAMKAVNQEDILAAAVGNPDYYRLCGSFFGCGTLYGDETGGESLTSGGDIEAAKALLAEAGYDGTPVVMLQATDVAAMAPLPIAMADALRKAGFTVEIQSMDWQTLTTRRAIKAPASEGGWNMIFTFTSIAEADTPLKNSTLASRGEESWFGWPTDPAMEEARAAFNKAVTLEDQKAAARAVQAEGMHFVTYVPLGEYSPVQARRDTLTDMLISPIPVFWNLKKAE